jgi:hypothetical protein
MVWGGSLAGPHGSARPSAQSNETEELLLVLRNNWAHYLPQLQKHLSGSTQDKPQTILQEILETEVACTDGSLWPLRQTVLPLDELKQIGTELPFLDIPDPEDQRWLEFSKFGVITTKNMQLYLRQLQATAKLDKPDGVEVSTITELYDQIAKRSASKFGSIK